MWPLSPISHPFPAHAWCSRAAAPKVAEHSGRTQPHALHCRGAFWRVLAVTIFTCVAACQPFHKMLPPQPAGQPNASWHTWPLARTNDPCLIDNWPSTCDLRQHPRPRLHHTVPRKHTPHAPPRAPGGCAPARPARPQAQRCPRPRPRDPTAAHPAPSARRAPKEPKGRPGSALGCTAQSWRVGGGAGGQGHMRAVAVPVSVGERLCQGTCWLLTGPDGWEVWWLGGIRVGQVGPPLPQHPQQPSTPDIPGSPKGNMGKMPPHNIVQLGGTRPGVGVG